MFKRLVSLDHEITLAINSIHSHISDQLWCFMSDKKVWIPFYLMMITVLVWRLGWKKALLSIVAIALTILACDQTAELLKYSVERLRPCYSSNMIDNGLRILERRGSLFGFFSAHSADSFGLAACISYLFLNWDKNQDRNRKFYKTANVAALYLWAFMVALSRIFVGKHYFGDVVVGTLIGLCYGHIFAYLSIYASKRFPFLRPLNP